MQLKFLYYYAENSFRIFALTVTYYILLWLYTNLMKLSISLFASTLTNDMLNIDISPIL